MPNALSHTLDLPLDRFAILRSRQAQDACTRIGHWFSPHRLVVEGSHNRLDVRLNKVALRDTAIHVLRYGTQVTIDPARRGDFYMLQLPLTGHAHITSGRDQAFVDRNALSILLPHTPTRMSWSSDCSMILLQVPTRLIQGRMGYAVNASPPVLLPAISRADPKVAAWCNATESIVNQLDQHASAWLSSAAAVASIEDFLLGSFTALLMPRTCGPELTTNARLRALRRAKEYICSHFQQPVTLSDIARHACVSERSLEDIFRQQDGSTPMAYLRQHRLQAVHRALVEHSGAGVTENAQAYGFTHMGRFAGIYRMTYGCSPSQTWRRSRS